MIFAGDVPCRKPPSESGPSLLTGQIWGFRISFMPTAMLGVSRSSALTAHKTTHYETVKEGSVEHKF